MKFQDVLALSLACFVFGSRLPTAYGQSSVQELGSEEGADEPPIAANPAFREADLFIAHLSKALPPIGRCIDLKSKLGAEAAKIPKSELKFVTRDYGYYAPDKMLEVCKGHFPVGKAVQDLYFTNNWKLLRYYQCQALAAGNPSLCGSLSAIKGQPSGGTAVGSPKPENQCREFYFQAVLAKALIAGSANAKKICQDMCQETDEARPIEGSSEVCSKMCLLMFANRDDPESVCDKAPRELWDSAGAFGGPKCKYSRYVLLFGKQDCSLFSIEGNPRYYPNMNKDDLYMGGCLAHSAFRKAYQAKNVELCGDSAICRVMMGAGAVACEPIVRPLKTQFCKEQKARHAQNVKSERSQKFIDQLAGIRSKAMQLDAACGKIIKESADAGEKAFAILNAKLPGSPGLKERWEKLSKLNVKRQKLVIRYGAIKTQ